MTYDQWKTDSGYSEKTPEEENEGRDCPLCGGDCSAANPPVFACPMTEAAKHDFWTEMGADARMARVRKVLSLDELRSIAIHAWDNPVYRLWQDADTAPQTGFFLAWSPDFPDMVSCWKAELFHQARKPGTPKHLAANHFTKWMPVPLPAKASKS